MNLKSFTSFFVGFVSYGFVEKDDWTHHTDGIKQTVFY